MGANPVLYDIHIQETEREKKVRCIKL